jgi:hypothetical protein
MWTNEGYDLYYENGKTTKSRADKLRITAEKYFIGRPNQDAEGSCSQLTKAAMGFADRRHEVAHGIVRPILWYWPILQPNQIPQYEASKTFCLVPPHYQRGWIKDGAPDYIYTSHELNALTLKLFHFHQDLMTFRHRFLPNPNRLEKQASTQEPKPA